MSQTNKVRESPHIFFYSPKANLDKYLPKYKLSASAVCLLINEKQIGFLHQCSCLMIIFIRLEVSNLFTNYKPSPTTLLPALKAVYLINDGWVHCKFLDYLPWVVVLFHIVFFLFFTFSLYSQFLLFLLSFFQEYPHCLMVKELDSEMVVSEFELHSNNYVHFRTNTLGKGMNPLIILVID